VTLYLMKIIPRALGPTANMCRRGPVGVPRALPSLLALHFIVLTLLTSTANSMNIPWNLPLSISSINCNSLNMSNTGAFNHKLKMYGITKLRTDIIFMCDIRLSNSQNVPSCRQAALTFRTNPYGAYDFYANSTRNKRGVGILIKKNSNFSVLEERRDAEENILTLRLLHQGNNRELIVGSIYGPNRAEPQFFNNLRDLLRNDNDVPIILGGDWNCTDSSEPVRFNPDLCNMQNLPNKRHSELLSNLCDDMSLADPYRVKFPNKKEFTFIPSDPIKKNRSLFGNCSSQPPHLIEELPQ
jgi:exonuclease III